MSQFPPAFDYLMTWEDAGHTWARATDNNGGEVIAGINSKSFPSQFAYVNSIYQPQRGPAVASFYQTVFWEQMKLGGIGAQDVANRVMDSAVNVWEPEAVEMLQRAVNSLLHAPGPFLAVDGIIGPETLAAVNQCAPDSLLAAYRQQRVNYYKAVVASHPEDAPYLAGWLRRAEA